MRQNGDIFAGDYLRQGSPTNTTRQESVPRWHATANIAIAATGVVHTSAIPLQAGDLVGAITFVTGTTAAGTPTAGYLALRSPAGVVLAQSADLGSTARAANTAFKIAMATAYLVPTAGLYLVDISFTATTVPSLIGAAAQNAVIAGVVVTGMPILAQTHGSAVGAAPPATIATPTTVATLPYYVITES
ncbi:MAG: hypothetical protein A2135_10080 [Actinobacteria bacterium RBG_16_67_15]|nr:MAG: hypothetical protein A2135_10080 [Actinobacteria bacterium RBG_16_67_15]